MRKLIWLALALALFVLAPLVQAVAQQGQATIITVRARAKDAKFIGTSMGGVLVSITDAETGQVLSQGMASGSTGPTGPLMRQPKGRYDTLSNAGTAAFIDTLYLERPRFVTISTLAPYGKKQAQVLSSTQMWLLPGKHILQNGVVLEVPGYVVDILTPQTHQFVGQQEARALTITANIVMMCGCPTRPGGLWDATAMQFTVYALQGGRVVQQKAMDYAGQSSTYQAVLSLRQSGPYEIMVTAYDPRTANTGVDRTYVRVR